MSGSGLVVAILAFGRIQKLQRIISFSPQLVTSAINRQGDRNKPRRLWDGLSEAAPPPSQVEALFFEPKRLQFFWSIMNS